MENIYDPVRISVHPISPGFLLSVWVGTRLKNMRGVGLGWGHISIDVPYKSPRYVCIPGSRE